MNYPQIPFQHHINEIILFLFNNRVPIDSNDARYISLLHTMASITKFAFDQDFCDFGSELVADFFDEQHNNPLFKKSDVIWNAYNENFFKKNGLQDFLQKYPLIGQIANGVLEQALNFDSEIRQAIENDTHLLSEAFNNNKPIGNLISISASKGDSHQKGKSTTVLQFEDGLKIVYKPRSGAMDTAFNLLIEEISIETTIKLKSFIVIDRGPYSWVEFIEHKEVSSEDALSAYYTRCGALIAICYVLNGTDFHYENIIAHGEYPVLIDLECLFGATDEMKKGAYSVYYTGLMPIYIYDGEEKAPKDFSGLGASGETILGTEVWKWKDVGTDAVRLMKEPGSFIAEGNQPKYNKQVVSPAKYYTQIIEGFKKTCNWFIKQKSRLDEPGFVLSHFKNKPFRIVIRYTNDYKFTLDNSCISDALLSEDDRKNEIYSSLNEFRTILYLKDNIKAAILNYEYDAIKEMNTPLFKGNTTDRGIYESGNYVGDNFFESQPYEFVINKIRRFNKAELDYQVNLIKSAFILRYGIDINKRKKHPRKQVAFDNLTVKKEAKKIASFLINSGVKIRDSYTWNCFTSAHNNQLAYNSVGSGFYDGALGISYYLYTLNRYDKRKNNAIILEKILDAEIDKYLSPGHTVDISYGGGISGLIFVLMKMKTEKSVMAAIQLAQLIDKKHIEADADLDMIKGSAGLILSLCLLYEHAPSAHVLELMTVAGVHLLDNLIMDDTSGYPGWHSNHFKKPLTGFSHGASGIAFALLRLYNITGMAEYKNAFYTALAFEDFYKTPDSSNWQDLRHPGSEPKNAWCHGATGIGLARLHAYKILEDASLLAAIDIAIHSTIGSLSVETIDFYCCGNIGRIDFLIEAARVLNRPDLLKVAQAFTMGIINKKNKAGYYQTYENANISLENPTLFRGTAGIGYILLRSMEDSEISCLGLVI